MTTYKLLSGEYLSGMMNLVLGEQDLISIGEVRELTSSTTSVSGLVLQSQFIEKVLKKLSESPDLSLVSLGGFSQTRSN